MRTSTSIVAAVALSLTVSQPLFSQEDESSTQTEGSTITLNGELLHVRWSDGDSFRILEGEHEGHGVRLGGFNALESYGPVHRWGEWTAQELAQNSQQAKTVASEGSWTCSSSGATDRYDRLLVTCDDLILAMVGQGVGHLYLVEGAASPDQIAAQTEARAEGRGMWEKGVPESIVTSLHSAAEEGEVYDRTISTTDGTSVQINHTTTYETCQEICHGDSCLVYVPYALRYGGERAECLR